VTRYAINYTITVQYY